jgi:hypothetical protein
MYLFVLGIPKYLQVCTKMYPVFTWKNKKLNGKTLGIEQLISLFAVPKFAVPKPFRMWGVWMVWMGGTLWFGKVRLFPVPK